MITPASKKEFALIFIDNLIKTEQFKPFLHFDDLAFGFFDFQFITKFKGQSIITIRQELIIRKSFSCQWFTSQLTKVFTQISDYLLLNDPRQSLCKKGLQLISDFETQYILQFRKKKSGATVLKNNEPKRIRSSFTNQLQMIFYLKNSEHDEQLMRKIGELCQIIREDEQHYTFDLSKSNIWQSIIQKSNQ